MRLSLSGCLPPSPARRHYEDELGDIRRGKKARNIKFHSFLLIYLHHVRSLHLPAPSQLPQPPTRRLGRAVSLGNVRQEVEHTARVAPLVVIPRDNLDEVVVEGDTGLGVENGRVGVAHHVGGDDVILGVGKDACM